MKTLLYFYCFNIFVFALFAEITGDKDTKRIAREKLKKKDVRDYTDADVEELYEQWEVKRLHISNFMKIIKTSGKYNNFQSKRTLY